LAVRERLLCVEEREQTRLLRFRRSRTRSTVSLPVRRFPLGIRPTLKSTVRDLYKKWKPHAVLMEESGTAIGLIEELQYDFHGSVAVKPDRDKVARVAIASAKFEAGDVYIPEEAVWLADLEAELFAFPARVTTTSAFLSATRSMTKGAGTWPPILWPMGRRGDELLIPEEAAPQFLDDAAPRNGMMLPPIPR